MSNRFSIQFGSGDPRTLTGMSPTFLIFVRMTDGATIASPSITESLTGSGIYQFTYGVTQPIAFLADSATTSPGASGRYVVGQIDPSDRIDEFGITLTAIGTSNIALGTTNLAIGTTLIGYGATGVALGTTTVFLVTGIGTTQIAEGQTIIAIGNTLLGIGNTVSVIGVGASLFALIGTTASLIGNDTINPSDLFGYMKRVNENIEGQQSFTKGSGVLNMYDRTGATLLAQRTVTNFASMVVKT